MGLPTWFTPATVKVIGEAVAAFVRLLIDAFSTDDDHEIKRLSDILPKPLKSRLALQHAEEKARRAFGG